MPSLHTWHVRVIEAEACRTEIRLPRDVTDSYIPYPCGQSRSETRQRSRRSHYSNYFLIAMTSRFTFYFLVAPSGAVDSQMDHMDSQSVSVRKWRGKIPSMPGPQYKKEPVGSVASALFDLMTKRSPYCWLCAGSNLKGINTIKKIYA